MGTQSVSRGAAGRVYTKQPMHQDRSARPRPALSSYGYAVVAALVAAAARLLGGYFGYQHQYALLYIAVLWVSWYGGVWPALLTTVLGAVSVAFLGIRRGTWWSVSSAGI